MCGETSTIFNPPFLVFKTSPASSEHCNFHLLQLVYFRMDMHMYIVLLTAMINQSARSHGEAQYFSMADSIQLLTSPPPFAVICNDEKLFKTLMQGKNR